ncbi:MAG: sensor histidine kinase [Nocardioidaceae bacterium]
MRPHLTSIRLWMLVAIVCAGGLGFIGARQSFRSITESQEQASDVAKDSQMADAIAARVARGAGTRALDGMQLVLPNDRILVYRDGRRIFAGPPVADATLELQVTKRFPGGRVVVRDFRVAGPDSSLELTLVVGAWVLLVIVVAVIATWLLARAIQRPIGRAAAAADRVAAGDFGARIGAVNPGEFGRLAEAFDLMADRLDAHDRDQRQFLADITHEIATPVNAISGLATALADGTLVEEEQRAETIDLIDTHTERLGSLLGDLRRLTRLDLAEPVRWEDVDVAAVCDSIVTRFEPAATRAGVELSAQAEHQLVTTDPRLLETILDNLVSNAIRYTPAGGTVQIRAVQSSRALVLAVTDTGIGIAHDDLERIFDRFYRTDRGRGRASGGSGLGLALARRCAQALGARIEVSSEPGRGTEFRFVLPAQRVESQHTDAWPAPTPR